jgi:TPR repeat protein
MSRFLVAVLLVLLSRSAVGETVQLRCPGGTCLVPVRINDAITLNFVLDSGAADVAIPVDVFLTLMRTGTVKTSDFIGTTTATLADGSTQLVKRFLLRELRVGGRVVRNVTASMLPVKGAPLLGQSFLSKLPAWTIDNRRHLLVLNDVPGSTGGRQTAALPSSQPMPPAATPAPPSTPDSRLSVGELVDRARKAYADKNYSEAMRWYRMAADQGDAAAQVNVGGLYANGWGVPQNYPEAMQWFRKAADQGNASAQNDVGGLFANGRGVPRDYTEAMRWFRMAATQGYVPAQDNIGALYENGSGVSQDYAEAMRWFRMAADRGFAVAQNKIGVLYQRGWAVSQDYGEAMRWYQMAAAQGYAPAQVNIGRMIARGWGVGKDCTAAKPWFEKAAATGDDVARGNLRSGAEGACPW